LKRWRIDQTVGWIKMPLGTEVGLGPGGIVLDKDSARPRKKTQQPPSLLGPCLLWPNGCVDQDATWYGSKPRTRRHCVRWGLSPSTEKDSSLPHFSAHVYCDQTAGLIKMSLGTMVGLGPGDIVLYDMIW